MSGRINVFANVDDQNDLVAGFAAELEQVDASNAEASAQHAKAYMVDLIVRCANKLDAANLDSTVADDALRFITE